MKSYNVRRLSNAEIVAPFAGAWIEIGICKKRDCNTGVAPFAGAWIEMMSNFLKVRCLYVAPFAGAWIEIMINASADQIVLSLPSRERGLKSLIPKTV